MYFINRSRGWAVGNGGQLARTTDGGATWIQTKISNESFYDVYFVDSLHGWVVGDQGRIIYSNDGGVSWVIQSGSTYTPLISVYFKDTLHGIAFSDQDFLRTKNGGASWEVDQIDDYQGHPGLHFVDTVRGWISGSGGNVWHTMDAGINWIPLSTDGNLDLNDLHFLNESVG